MKGKKSLLAVVFLIALGINCYGNNNFKIIDRPKISYRTSFVIPTKQSLRNESPVFATTLGFDFHSIKATIDNYITVNSLDTVGSVLSIPFSFEIFELGVGFKYHLYDYFDSFMEQDILLNQYYAFLYKDIVRFQINTGYDFKFSSFKYIKNIKPVFYQTIYLGLDIIWNINKYIQFYAGFNSMSNWDFSLIGTPFYNLGSSFNIKDNLTIGLNYEMKMIDMVAVAETISEMLLIIYMEVSL